MLCVEGASCFLPTVNNKVEEEQDQLKMKLLSKREDRAKNVTIPR